MEATAGLIATLSQERITAELDKLLRGKAPRDGLESLRFDSLWLSERLTADAPDPLTALAFAAGRTERLKLGTSILVLPGRNPVVLAKEMASGEGETLSALAGLYGVTDSDKSAFFSMAKDGYGQIFTNEATTAGDMVSNLNGLMGSSIGLSVYVPKS